MILALTLCQLSVLVAANPFHKYPQVFLLDVGNEELEKTNTEQIRLSVPGGSVALRYPAIGDGNTIGHLRVSSIDFGTAFKANIVDGGPGYKYAVLVLMGNPGVPYDAVVTVQTVNDQNIRNIGFVPNSDDNAVSVEKDANTSAEDFSEDSPQPNNYQSDNSVQSSNAELMQSSDNVYRYAESKVMDHNDNFYDDNNSDDNNDGPSDESDDEDDDSEQSESSDNDDGSDQRDIHKEYANDIDQIDDSSVEVKGIDAKDDDDDDDDDGEISPELAQSVPNDYAEDNEVASIIRSRINANNDGLRPYLSGGEVYYEDVGQKNTRPDYQQPLDYESPDEIQQIFNDGEVHNDDDKYRDSNNNNYIDSDDNFAVAY